MFPILRFLNLLLIGWLLLTLPALSQKIYYVTPDGAGTKDGSSWENAYEGTNLQPAIDAAGTYWKAHQEQTVEVWVAQGIYKPTTGTNRFISFVMRDHVAVYGGFVGNETTLSGRPPITLSTPSGTILSGEIGDSGYEDNSNHVIYNLISSTEQQLSRMAVLDGFVITGGYVSGGSGCGMLNQAEKADCSPTIRNCSFRGNRGRNGGAMTNASVEGNAEPQIINCSFIDNTVELISFSAFGGAVFNETYSTGNCSTSFTNCVFFGNSAQSGGGAIANSESAKLNLINCTFVNNSAQSGGALFILGPLTTIDTKISNCLFWNNGGSNTTNLTAPQLPKADAQYSLFDVTVTGYVGDHNLTTDTSPFENETDLQLRPCSPAIDAGDPNSTTATSGITDLAGNPRFYNNGRIDIGARLSFREVLYLYRCCVCPVDYPADYSKIHLCLADDHGV
jgi:hypothetical protein